MPIRKSDYHPDWSAISLQVRTDAGWKCEWCGAPGGKVIQRLGGDAWVLAPERVRADDTSDWEPTEGMSWTRLKFHGLTRVILSTAHLDRNSKNNERKNLASLCQRDHLRHDIHQHIRNRMYGRYHTREHQLKLEI